MAAAALVLAASLGACSTGGQTGSTGTGAGPTEVTFSYLWSGNEAKVVEEVIAAFNASQDKVKVIGVSSPDFQKQLASMSASEGSFDISDHFGNGVGAWASKGVIAPLDEYIAADKVNMGDFLPAAVKQMTYDGKIYSMPVGISAFQLLYNKTLFAEAGISTPPKTAEELAADIAKLTKVDGSGNITQLGLGNPDLGTTITTLGYAFGGTWDGPDNNTPTPNDPANVAALDFYKQNVIDKYGADNVTKFTAGLGQYMSAQDPFYTGKVAMVIDGNWQAVNIPKTMPNLDWGVTSIPVPAAKPELAGTTQLTVSTLFIPSNSKHKKEAFEFVNYMTSGQGAAMFTKGIGSLPPRTSLLSDPSYASIPQFSAWLTALQSPKVHALGSGAYASQYAADLAEALKSVTDGSATAQAALDSVANKAKQYG